VIFRIKAVKITELPYARNIVAKTTVDCVKKLRLQASIWNPVYKTALSD
jgi:hypothetical protein